MIASDHEAETGPPRAGRRRAVRLHPESIRARLVRLVLTLLIPTLLVAGVLLWSLDQQARSTQEKQLAATARTLALVVDGRLAEQVAALNSLAVSDELARRDWRQFTAQARTALDATDSWVVAWDASGRQAVNTFSPTAARTHLPPTGAGTTSWSGRRGDVMVSNLVYGPAARQPIIAVVKPVALADGEKVNLSVTTTAASFGKLLDRQELPPRWMAAILDSRRRVIAVNRPDPQYIGRQSSPDMLKALAAQPRGIVPNLKIEGVRVIAAYDQLPGYGWTAVVAMPHEEATGAVRQAILLGAIIGALLLTAAVVFALRMARRIAAPVETLAEAASEWVAGGSPHFPAATGLVETDGLSAAFASALRAVDQRDEHHKLLINELNHRVKNTLATVQSIAVHTRKAAGSIGEYHAALEGRVVAMSRAHEILTRTSWSGAELGVLARETLDAFAGPQLRIVGPPTQVGPTDALNLALILYELATNASKHGALSRAGGQVTLSWRPIDGSTRVAWVESGGPPVTPPKRSGFGSRLIKRATHDLQPSALVFASEGVRCEFTVPAQGPPPEAD